MYDFSVCFHFFSDFSEVFQQSQHNLVLTTCLRLIISFTSAGLKTNDPQHKFSRPKCITAKIPWQSAIVFALKEWEGAKERNAKLAWSYKYAYQERAWHSS